MAIWKEFQGINLSILECKWANIKVKTIISEY